MKCIFIKRCFVVYNQCEGCVINLSILKVKLDFRTLFWRYWTRSGNMDRYHHQFEQRFGSKQAHDVANWGYIILYLFVILGSLIGNGLFLFTIKRNQNLRRSHHFLLSSLAIRDLIVTILVIPFAMDSQVSLSIHNIYIYIYLLTWNVDS